MSKSRYGSTSRPQLIVTNTRKLREKSLRCILSQISRIPFEACDLLSVVTISLVTYYRRVYFEIPVLGIDDNLIGIKHYVVDTNFFLCIKQVVKGLEHEYYVLDKKYIQL